MMNKKQTSRIGYVKYILFMPIVVVLLLANNVLAISRSDISMEAEKDAKNSVITTSVQDAISQEESIFTHVQVMPQFSGGDKEMMTFLSKNLRYPVDAKQKKIQGVVTLRFIVNKTGKIEENVEILRSVDPSLDNEAIRVVKMMPNWVPGKQSGQNVSVYYSLPIRFKLADAKSSTTSGSEDASIVVVGYGD